MSFLAPLFLLGALAIALPVIFHLIRRTSRERVPFSSLMFLVPTPPRVTRRSRIENWFLLLLRCLVICLLAFAFARPFLSGPVAMDSASREAQRIIVLIDTSASMRRGNLWAQAKSKAEEVLRQAAPGDHVACFSFDRQPARVITFEEWSAQPPGERASLASQRLDAITPGWASTHLGNALMEAAEAFDSYQQEDGAKRIVLISDLQEGSRLDGLQGFEWPRNLELAIEPLSAPGKANAAVQLVAEREEAGNASSEALPRLRVSNSSESNREQFRVGWASSKSPGAQAAAIDLYIPPGQSRIFTAPKPPEEAGFDRLVLTGDDHDFDNTAFYSPAQPQQARILFLGSDDPGNPAQPLFYLRRAFPQTRRLQVNLAARNHQAPLLPEDADEVSLLVVADSLQEGRIEFARNFLVRGGTVLMPLASAEMIATMNSLIGNASEVGAKEAAPDRYAMLGQIDFEHPLFAPFSDPRFSDFTKIHFWRHRQVSFDQVQDARVIARFDNGDAALAEVPVGKGALLVLTSGWHPQDSQLALSSKFVPLLYSILDQSGGLKEYRTHYFVGDPVSIPGGEAVTLRKPDGSQFEVKAGELFAGTDQPGIYAAANSPFRFAVNVAPEESRTAPMRTEDLERLGLPLKQLAVNASAGRQERQTHLLATELEGRQKFWRWVIVAALVILVMETVLAGRLTRRTATLARG
jgi:hypothetical protein